MSKLLVSYRTVSEEIKRRMEANVIVDIWSSKTINILEVQAGYLKNVVCLPIEIDGEERLKNSLGPRAFYICI